jgi:hypothetical protein
VTAIEPDRVLEVLEPDECRRLIGTVPIGRLGFTEGALPTIQPVHFGVFGDEILIPASAGSKVVAASVGAIVAFEVDDFDVEGRTGWNVTVIGPAQVLWESRELDVAAALGLVAWAPDSMHRVIAVQMALVSGRRLRPASPTRPAEYRTPQIRHSG